MSDSTKQPRVMVAGHSCMMPAVITPSVPMILKTPIIPVPGIPPSPHFLWHFYEWNALKEKSEFSRMDEGILFFAGLWDASASVA